MRCCVRVIWSSEPIGPCKGMGVSHDLEGLRCCGYGPWPSGCSADCNALGLMGDPGVVLSVQWFLHVMQPRSANAEYSAMDMCHDLEDML